MGKSPSGFKWDMSEGAFGPFAGQLYVGDQHHAWVMRVSLEKVDGHWQGACYRFREAFQSGIIRLEFGKDHSLFAGMSDAGWGSKGNRSVGSSARALDRKDPVRDSHHAGPTNGFELNFTTPVDKAVAENLENYSMESYTLQAREPLRRAGG